MDPSDNNDSEGNTFGRYLSTKSANSHIRTALLNAPPTQDAVVAGIGTTMTGYVIRFKNQASADAARSNTEWLNELGNNKTLVKPRFGVAVHRTRCLLYIGGCKTNRALGDVKLLLQPGFLLKHWYDCQSRRHHQA